MTNGNRIVRISAEELTAKRKRDGNLTDWARVRALTDVDVEAAIAADPHEAGMVVDWNSASVSMPERKQTMTIRLDSDVLEFYRRMGRGYQTKINAVLRSYMEHAKG